MILYHMDRSGCFPTSGELSLHPLSDLPHDIAASRFFLDLQSGVSKHCLNYFTDSASMLIAIQSMPLGQLFVAADSLAAANRRISSQLIELTVELVRRQLFPHYPSRLISLFAVEQISDFKKWGLERTEQARVFQISAPDNLKRFDARHLRGGITFTTDETGTYCGCLLTAMYDQAIKYWSCEPSADPLWEYLVPLPAQLHQVLLCDRTSLASIPEG